MTEEEKINGENNYSASNIQVLEGLEAVRMKLLTTLSTKRWPVIATTSK